MSAVDKLSAIAAYEVSINNGKEHIKINKIYISENLFKVFIFVQTPDENSILGIIRKVGAGIIGEYAECSFTTDATLHARIKEKEISLPGKNIETVITKDKIAALVQSLATFQKTALCIYSIVPTVDLPKAKL